jgi:hypothetical protein
MGFDINYQKRKNNNLFNKFETIPSILLTNAQNFIPIYNCFFSLSQNNFNSINLNHKYYIYDIKEQKKYNNSNIIFNDFIFNGKMKLINDTSDNFNINQKCFIKIAPLLDPYKYLVGKYNHNDNNLFKLPSFNTQVHSKIMDTNNSSYIDGFFTYLSSMLLNYNNFIHGLDFYGSFLGIKNNFKINIIDDLDYLIHSEFFNKNKNILFEVQDYTHLIVNEEIIKPLKPINISNLSQKSQLSIKSFDETIFENIFTDNNNTITLEDIKNNNIDLLDITNSIGNYDTKKTTSLKSGTSCSSRTSHTNNTNDKSMKTDNNENDNEIDNEIDNDNETKESTINSNENENETIWEDDSENQTEFADNEETLFLTFPKFPVQLICMEHCENTLDHLILNGELNEEQWFSTLMQIIMILITYQKVFSFTHNDLHTNNIMFIPTNKKYLYYCYKKKFYKVPTFGKIYKIIDFGRSIYKFKGNIFCSDSFQPGGDASTQYNTEPYYNDKKPRLEPNFSFDLCRLACSIFDYLVDDLDEIKNLSQCEPIVKLIVEWCRDDNGVNILYKNNGEERYPDFKLYKMIARCVHNHTPQVQLERSEFSKYIVSKKNIPKDEIINNIDELPIYI